MSDPDLSLRPDIDRKQVLCRQSVQELCTWNRLRCRTACNARRRLDAAPRASAIACDAQPIRSCDVNRVAAVANAIRHHVLPLGPELAELPVLPRAAAIGRAAPAIANRAIPDRA